MTRSVSFAVALALVAGGCSEDVKGQRPVLSSEPEPVALERFAGRLHLDLTGQKATTEYLADTVAILGADKNSAAVRGTLADELLDSQEFADTFVSELENRVFGGESPEGSYDLICSIVRSMTCDCPPPTSDVCAGCSCAELVEIFDDRASFRGSAADLGRQSATTSAIERRFAGSRGFLSLLAPEQAATAVFEAFLLRPAEPDDVRNAGAMILGLAITPANPSGKLFGRHGTDSSDFIDIVFESEIYRDAMVDGVFERYLGRLASPAERAHFSARIDKDDPDIRPVVRAVISSGEYFDQ